MDFSPRSYHVSDENRLLFMGGTSSIIVGFSLANAHGCESRYLSLLTILQCRYPGTAPLTLTLILGGTGLLISAGVYEVQTTRNALFPKAIFNNFNISMSTFPLVLSFLIIPSYSPYCQSPSQRRIQCWNILSSFILPGMY